MTDRRARILELLIHLYGQEVGQDTFGRLMDLLSRHAASLPVPPARHLDQRDILLISYPDQIRNPGEAPLRTLATFCERYLDGLVRGLHLLPFFPSSSDHGFAVTDYRRVNPSVGTWQDISHLRLHFHLMVDAVLNHVSSRSAWFESFLRNEPGAADRFIVVDGDPDLSAVVRPRALPLLTEFETSSGPKKVWTTFSADQIDLNYRSPDLLLEVVDFVLLYVEQGADFLRLDAAAYLWKQIGTPCIHLPQTHMLIRLLRAVLDEVAPHVFVVTETNVPHTENLAYFGDGDNEAQLVYNFALPPLIAHAFLTRQAGTLSSWADGLRLPGHNTAFLNFLASHDGIGLQPVCDLIPAADVDRLIRQALDHGGYVSNKSDPAGGQTPYELNISYFDMLSSPDTLEPRSVQVSRFMAAEAIILSLAGVPAIYFHSLVGSRSWPEGPRRTGQLRAINRQRLDLTELEHDLLDPSSMRHEVFGRHRELLMARASSPAFHPYGSQQVFRGNDRVFGLWRFSPDARNRVLCLHNISPEPADVDLASVEGSTVSDLLNGGEHWLAPGHLHLEPYQVRWLDIHD